MISLIWKPKNNSNKLIYKPRLTQKTNLWLPEGENEGERNKLGAWGQQIQTILPKINKQQ